MSATEALHGIPAWEYDLLIASLRTGPGIDGDTDISGDGDATLEPPVPEALRGL